MGTNGGWKNGEHDAALDVLSLLSGKWEPIIVLQLRATGPLGFNQLLDGLPDISGKVLSETLASLETVGLVERRVVSETPLRVQYDLTPPGQELDSVFEAMSSWGERHLEPTRPTVLVAGADRRQTEMYSQWLADHYTVECANDPNDLESKLQKSIDVTLVSEDLPGTSRSALLERVWAHSRTVLIVRDRPGIELLELPCDDVLQAPVVRSTVLDAVDQQFSKRDESDDERVRSALVARRSVAETALSDTVSEAEMASLTERLESESAGDSPP